MKNCFTIQKVHFTKWTQMLVCNGVMGFCTENILVITTLPFTDTRSRLRVPSYFTCFCLFIRICRTYTLLYCLKSYFYIWKSVTSLSIMLSICRVVYKISQSVHIVFFFSCTLKYKILIENMERKKNFCDIIFMSISLTF